MELPFWITTLVTVLHVEMATSQLRTDQCCSVHGHQAGIHVFCMDKQLNTFRLSSKTWVTLEEKTGEMCWQGRKKSGSTSLGSPTPSRKVIWLDLSSNSLTSFPDVSHPVFAGLYHLNLSHNQIQEVPGDLLRLVPDLQSLDLSFNELSFVPDFAHVQLPFLTFLDLSHNSLEEVPGRGLQGLFRLKTLVLSHNRIRQVVSDSFLNVSALQVLTLRSNVLETLPLGVFEEHVWDLDLSGNLLEWLPEGVFHGLTELKSLNLSGNKQSTIPPGGFRGLTSLQNLDLSSNQLEAITRGLFEDLGRLEHMTLAKNKVKAISGDTLKGLKALKDLDLNSNQLTTIRKASFTHVHRLLNLNLKSNSLKNLHEHVFAGLKWLEYMDLSGNMLQLDLQSFPEEVFSPLHKLRTLLIHGNDLRKHGTYPTAMFTHLLNVRHLSIDTFSETTFPPQFGKLPSLRKLDLPLCKMTSVKEDTFRGFRGSNLEHLKMSGCPLEGIEDCAFCGLQKLEALSISRNSSPNPLSFPGKLLDTGNSVLRHLNLSGMHLSTDTVQALADHTLKNLDGLEVLDLSQNQLQDVNITLKGGLKELLLAGNRFQSLPVDVTALKRLTVLDVGDNHLSSLALPERSGLDRLAEASDVSLRLHGNRLECPEDDCSQVDFWNWLSSTRVRLDDGEGGSVGGGYPCVRGKGGKVVTVAEAAEACSGRMSSFNGGFLTVVVAVVVVGVGAWWWWGRDRGGRSVADVPEPEASPVPGVCGISFNPDVQVVQEYDQILDTSTDLGDRDDLQQWPSLSTLSCCSTTSAGIQSSSLIPQSSGSEDSLRKGPGRQASGPGPHNGRSRASSGKGWPSSATAGSHHSRTSAFGKNPQGPMLAFPEHTSSRGCSHDATSQSGSATGGGMSMKQIDSGSSERETLCPKESSDFHYSPDFVGDFNQRHATERKVPWSSQRKDSVPEESTREEEEEDTLDVSINRSQGSWATQAKYMPQTGPTPGPEIRARYPAEGRAFSSGEGPHRAGLRQQRVASSKGFEPRCSPLSRTQAEDPSPPPYSSVDPIVELQRQQEELRES